MRKISLPAWRLAAQRAGRPTLALVSCLLVLLGAWAAVAALDAQVDLGSQALPLVLAGAALGAVLPAWAAAATCLGLTLAFNWFFVPPRGSLNVALPQHLLLLGTMLCVSTAVALLVARQRRLAEQAAWHARQLEQLHTLNQALRQSLQPEQGRQALADALAELGLTLQALWLAGDTLHPPALLGQANADERSGLQLCQHQGALGPDTGRYENLPAWYLPLRGRQASPGAALLTANGTAPLPGPGHRAHAQALCDQLGLALEQAQAQARATQAQQQAQGQQLRNTLLAAISHDYRTPLAIILGAASALNDQAGRLTPTQQQRLAQRIVDEAGHLRRLTDNVLQLARLDAPHSRLQLDWESPEELLGSLLQRLRPRDPSGRLQVQRAPNLPLLYCDGVLLLQLLENLVDNALNYSPPDTPVQLRLHTLPASAGASASAHASATPPAQLLLAVADRGPGVPPAWQTRIFDAFERGDPPPRHPAQGELPSQRGTGLGLALCRAIAQAHGGSLSLRLRRHGGSCFECRLPLSDPPPAPPATEAPNEAPEPLP